MQILLDGVKNAVVKSTGAETIDVSTLTGNPTRVVIDRIQADPGAATDCQILWDATADVAIMPISGPIDFCFKEFGGIKNTEAAGVTGDIVVAGTGVIGVILHLRKT